MRLLATRLTAIASAARRLLFSPLSLFTTGVNGAWYDPSDTTTLYRDAAGTLPVTAVEQPVGLMLDKRDTAYSTYFDGTEDGLTCTFSSAPTLSGDFTLETFIYDTGLNAYANVFGWRSAASNWEGIIASRNNNSNNITVTINNGTSAINQTSGTYLKNTWNHVALTKSGNTITLWVNGVNAGSATQIGSISPGAILGIGYDHYNQVTLANLSGYVSNYRVVKGTALYTANFTPPTAPLTAVAGTSLLTCGTSWSGNPAITTVGNTRADKLNPFTMGTGNHAFNGSGNSANFPVLSARYNLLTKSEQFDDAVWFKGNATISANVTTAPDGTLSADALFETTTNGAHYIDVPEPGLTVSSGVTYKRSIRAKYLGRQWIAIQIYDNSAGYAWFDIQNGVVGTVQAGVTATIEPLANGWYNCTVSRTVTGTSIYVGVQTALADNSVVTFAGDTSKGIYIWGADLRVANDALNQPAYQRVNTSTDYDTVGFKPYLRFNGTNQWLQTNSIDFSYGDKMFVSAGVRNLNSSLGIYAELSTAWGSNNGAFVHYQESNATNSAASKGTATGIQAQSAFSSIYATPNTIVSTSTHDIAGDLSALRINGSASGTNGTADKGVGNFGNYPMFLGARAGTSLWFNGRLYGMVVAGKQASAAEITSTETYINQKTGAF